MREEPGVNLFKVVFKVVKVAKVVKVFKVFNERCGEVFRGGGWLG